MTNMKKTRAEKINTETENIQRSQQQEESTAPVQTAESGKAAVKKSGAIDQAPVFYAVRILLSFIPAGLFAAVSAITGSRFVDMLPALVFLTVLGLLSVFVLTECDRRSLWRYDNGDKRHRFAIVYLGGVMLSVLCALTLPGLWPGLPVAAALVVFSGLPQALSGYMIMITLQYFLASPEPVLFIASFITGMVGILLFAFLDKEFSFAVPLICGLLFQTVSDLGGYYSAQGRLSSGAFVISGIHLLISFLLLTVMLKLLRDKVIHLKSDKYSEINDPEFVLLTQLKEKNARAYYHAVHTAHFCDKLSQTIGADTELCRAGGYYHKIGRMRGDSNLKNALDIAEEYGFPDELKELLMEYGGKNTPLRSKEAAIVLLSDAMVSSVMFLFDKNKDAKLNYEQIAQVVFDKQLESGVLDDCSLTLEDFARIKVCFSEEKLYYDFLR